jgi:hypothetical protein
VSDISENTPTDVDHTRLLGYPQPPRSHANNNAVVGMALGILSLFTLMILIGFILGLIGLGLSIAGLVSARRTDGTGMGFAITGLVTSSLTTALLVWISMSVFTPGALPQ